MSHRTRRRLVRAIARLPRCPCCGQAVRTTRERYAFCVPCGRYAAACDSIMPQFSEGSDENERAVFQFWIDGHDGEGWYFYGEDDYSDEGSFGAYATLREACVAARENGYRR